MTAPSLAPARRSLLAMTRSRVPQPVQVIALAGALDLETSPTFADYVEDTLLARPGTTALVLDLTELTFLSSGGLRHVEKACARAEGFGVHASVVVGTRDIVARAFGSGGTRTFRTRREALEATLQAPPAGTPIRS